VRASESDGGDRDGRRRRSGEQNARAAPGPWRADAANAQVECCMLEQHVLARARLVSSCLERACGVRKECGVTFTRMPRPLDGRERAHPAPLPPLPPCASARHAVKPR